MGFARRDLTEYEREGLLEELVRARIVERAQKFFEPARAVDAQGLPPRLRLRRVPRAEEERREAAHVVEVKMAHPHGAQVRPVAPLLRHAVDARRRRVEQQRAARGLDPVRG